MIPSDVGCNLPIRSSELSTRASGATYPSDAEIVGGCIAAGHIRGYARQLGVPETSLHKQIRTRGLRDEIRNGIRAQRLAQGPIPTFDPVKHGARMQVRDALRAGTLVRQPCEVCGTKANIEAHHDDYAKPLDVRWLCRKHHAALHRAPIKHGTLNGYTTWLCRCDKCRGAMRAYTRQRRERGDI
jgi:hypothetical protein